MRLPKLEMVFLLPKEASTIYEYFACQKYGMSIS